MYLITFIAAVGGLLFGFDTGIISGALVFLQDSFVLTTFTKEVVVGSVVLGALFGALVSGYVADRYGRRTMLIVASILFLIGTGLSTFATNLPILITGRLLLGVAIGIASYTVPLYISEMAPAHRRGQLVLMSSIAITGGEAIAFMCDYLLAPTASWRWMFALGFAPALLLLLGMMFLPATPRWLLLKGLSAEARDVLGRIRQASHVAEEMRDIQQQLGQKTARLRDLFGPKIRGVLIIGLSLGILQQFTGINTVMYYGPFIFKAIGFQTAETQILATFLMGLVNTFMSIVAVCTVDRFGRRQLLMGGMAVAAVSLALVGVLFYSDQMWARWLMVVGLISYIAGYSISLGSMFWLMISEIYPLHLRTRAMSFVTAVQWAANFLVALTFLSVLQSVGPSVTFWLYGLMCLITIVFTYRWVPETKHVSLEQIESNLLAGKRLREIGQALRLGEA
ncbi:MAG: sugar porter family MFS transporter [Coxiellaceae bacterium]|nr:sugar porter family MFS transporter [Coxiellaceae bacterium]